MSEQPTPKISDLLLEDEMRDSYLTYAMSVIMSRALPDVRDGLKPSQRRILVAMNDLNLGPRAKHRKCAKIAGDTSGNYHPHGEAVIYPTLVRMAQPFNMRYPMVDGQGNFGSIDGDPAAAMRYTEARMTSAAVEMMEDIKLETVDFQPNYDETITEPTVLPGRFPNLLVNGGTGIAVGMATSLPPHNLREICDALIKVVDHPDTTIDELCTIVKGPDFPTGGILCGRYGVLQGYKTGRGNIAVRAKLHTEEARAGKTLIVVDEIPYQILKTTITERIATCVKTGSIVGISDIRDESDRKGMRLVVEIKKDADPDIIINLLYQHTPLQSNFSIINIALVNGQPRTLNLRQMLDSYIDHRKEVIRRRTVYLLKRAQQRAHILEGLILATADIDEIIQLIKTSNDPKHAKQRLMEKPLRLQEQEALLRLLPESFINVARGKDLFLSGPQADAILSMQLQRLTGLEIERLAGEYSKLSEQIAEYQAILRDERLVLDIIREDIYEIKEKYGDDRRTEISHQEVKSFNIEDLITDEQVVVTVTHEGYVKRVPLDTYRSQGRGGRGIKGSENKEGDWVEHLFTASTLDYLLFFTNQGRVYSMRVYDIPSMTRTSKGRSVANLLKLMPDEKVALVLPLTETTEHYAVMATRQGVIKKTAMESFANIRSNGIIAISLQDGDELVGVVITTGKDELILTTKNGMSIRFNEDDVRPMGRTARGVRGIKLRKSDEVVDLAIVEIGESLLTVCEQGYGKRTPMDEYRLQSRGGIGIINIKASERNGHVVAARTVKDTDDLMLITANGIVIRFSLKDIRPIGRNTQGVRMVRLDEGDQLVTVTRLAKEEGDDAPATDPSRVVQPTAEELAAAQAEAEAAEPEEIDDTDVADAEGADDAEDAGDDSDDQA